MPRPQMNLDARIRVLRQVPYFRALSTQKIETLASGLRVRQLRRGEMIFRKGEESQGLHVVMRGAVRTIVHSSDGRQQVLKLFGPGRTFGDVSAFDSEPYPADAVATSDSLIAIIPRRELIELLRSNPDAAIDVIRLFASRLRAYKQVVEDLSLRPVIARVARVLVDRARGSGTLIEEPPRLHQQWTQDDVAAMVGSVREVVQRALKTLERAELIRMSRGRIRVLDVDALDGWTDRAGSGAPSRERHRADQDRHPAAAG